MSLIYKQPETNIWRGRIDRSSNSKQFHQIVTLIDVNHVMKTPENKTFCIIGFESDEGVRRNKGRIGAAQAPNKIRKFIANLPFHLDNGKIIDVGNVSCQDMALEEAQKELGFYLSQLFEKQCTPIIFGGGHETVYGHYLGVRSFLRNNETIGIINIDAHFDLREDLIPSSGTMFRQILTQDTNVNYLCLGIQKFGNTKALFDAASQFHCEFITEEDIIPLKNTFKIIDHFTSKHDYIILTLCMDSIIQSAAPGVSAPSPLGLDPKIVKHLIRYIVSKENILSFDISEVNPLYDENGKTLRLASYFVAEAIDSFKGVYYTS